ncbi:MAG: ATP synthase F1 subunit gamma [Chloroflexi bacterium CFX1]|nr:ATP synthase F1 subunit gamma [Chloroflexi bacterium CFX1]MCK6566683.1 ATP synthase F1 subunit gamma [Anaerolineales bacterium]MCQ3952280.1 ATP synthase F1 subunit gamma [Chloroflexota bacterium]MDL1918294.1 ATP synthase F1 subunit gamma [Chloroflexi bacterium CFX5]NUQ57795.1 ATP synthase F1 subunit gamma [Anaerolineales bacterium]
MASAREMRLRIKSVKNISQVTRALETVSASKVRKAINAVMATRSYATKAWQVLKHVAEQPGRDSLHPLLTKRPAVKNTLAVIVTGDRGLAGAYNSNVIRFTAQTFDRYPRPVKYIAVGRKGRDLLYRRRKDVLAEFSSLPAAPSFNDVAAIGRLAVQEYEKGAVDEVFLIYTDFINMGRQAATVKKLLPLELESGGLVEDFEHKPSSGIAAAYEYEPDGRELLDAIIPRFTALQVYQAILESQASEHAARMIAMRNATDNAKELVGALQLAYNKVRQQGITNDILDIVGGAEALAAN